MFVLRGWQVYVRGGLSEVVIFAGGLVCLKSMLLVWMSLV